MYCVHCGADGAMTFCAACGKRQRPTNQVRLDDEVSILTEDDLISGDGVDAVSANEVDSEVSPISEALVSQVPDSEVPNSAMPINEVLIDAILVDDEPLWINSLQYEWVLQQDAVRRRLASAGRDAPAGLNSEDILAIFDAVSPIGISLGKLNEVLIPIYDKMGFSTRRTAIVQYAAPAGRVLVATLCAMAGMSLEIKDFHQQPDACGWTAKIPSSLITNVGELMVSIDRKQFIEVRIGSKIAGQLFDWGKSKRLIDDLVAQIYQDLANQLQGRATPFRRVA